MARSYFITKERTLLPSQDFGFLLKEGLRYVEKLGHKFWTDYNPHDPGVTILDVLCYAITELGYRTDFDIKNLLANASGKIENNTFFTAAEIFTNAALTEMDYRKLLIDIEGVSNAWILATKRQKDANGYWLSHDNEVKVYLNRLEDKLSLENKDKANQLLPELALRGLIKVKVELEEDPVLGDLNTLVLTHAFWHENRWVNLKIVPQFISWNDPDARLFELMKTPDKITIISIEKTAFKNVLYLIVSRNAEPNEQLRFRIFCDDVAEVDRALDFYGIEQNICDFIVLFDQKKEKIKTVFSTIEATLQQNRNLTEDYLCKEIVEKVDIGVCADIEIEPGLDVIEIRAQIQLAIDKIISPKINFYTLNQLVEEGYHSEDIFLGPKLIHGFLKDTEVEKAQLPSEIHASDMIAVLMEVKGVKSVKNLLMTAYNELGLTLSKPTTNQSWVLPLSGEIKPVFNATVSKLLLFQKNIPFLLSENQKMQVELKVDMYQSQFGQRKLQNLKNDFEIPQGDYFNLDHYYSIQDDFPANYGIGKNPVSEKASDLRKAQAKQLKGYLYFFEQILADYFSQLYNAKALFNTVDVLKKQTYFPVFLDKNGVTEEDFYSKEVVASNLSTQLLSGETEDDVSLTESKSTYYDRKNRVLDHLIARFSESFNDYVYMMYQFNQDISGMGTLSFDNDDLIVDKQNFVNSYPEISSQRGLGMDYLNGTIENAEFVINALWDNNHRGGYEKRVARLLGINQIPLQDIVLHKVPQSLWSVTVGTTTYSFLIEDPETNLAEKWDWAQLHYLDQNKYQITTPGDSTYHLFLMDEEVKIVELDFSFESEEEAYEVLVEMTKKLNVYFENFYCLEHILLRPFEISYLDESLLSVCLNDNCDDPANNDPYSFKATIVLPGYLQRFKSIVFRKYAEKIFRQESPAHVLLKICWVNLSDMIGFQTHYKNWLSSHAQFRLKRCANSLTDLEKQEYQTNLENLVGTLKELNTIYPEGNLYDCQISESKNPIILGNTSLGTL